MDDDPIHALQKAITEFYQATCPGEYIGDWILIAHKDSVDLSAKNMSVVTALTPRDQHHYRSIGLVTAFVHGDINRRVPS